MKESLQLNFLWQNANLYIQNLVKKNKDQQFLLDEMNFEKKL